MNFCWSMPLCWSQRIAGHRPSECSHHICHPHGNRPDLPSRTALSQNGVASEPRPFANSAKRGFRVPEPLRQPTSSIRKATEEERALVCAASSASSRCPPCLCRAALACRRSSSVSAPAPARRLGHVHIGRSGRCQSRRSSPLRSGSQYPNRGQ
jgi:hypothetical protein